MTFTILTTADLDPQSANFLIQLTDINLQGSDNISLKNGNIFHLEKKKQQSDKMFVLNACVNCIHRQQRLYDY